jgi:YYY domain-containing protein
VTEALRFWALLEVIGLGAAPLAGLLLARLPGAGLGLAKVLGLLGVTWLVWLGGSTRLVPYGWLSAAGAIGLVCLAGLVAWRRAAPAAPDPLRGRLFWASEAVFLAGFAAMALLVAYAPDVWNTEKPMDMALLDAANRARSFPPLDPWLAGAHVNYYYLGHLALALPVKLAGVAPDRGYNLALAALFGLTAAAVFSVGATLWAAVRGAAGARRAGLAAVALVLVLGNLDGARELLAAGPYDWFAPARVVPDAITEFPWFSFILGDLHAHVLALPFTLLVLAFALQVVLSGPGRLDAAGAGVALGAMYAINAWSYPVLAGVLALAALAAPGRRAAAAAWLGVTLAVSVGAVLPFLLSFDPATHGVGLVGDGTQIRYLGLWFGSLALFAALAFAGRLWALAVALALGGLLAVTGHGVAVLLAVPLAVALRAVLSAVAPPPERAVWLLLAAGLACLLGPEVLYVRDEFDGSALYRMNTVFKLGYQAWLLLGLAGIGALALRRPGRAFAAAAAAVVLAGAAYPIAGTYARYGGFARAPTLDGLGWLRERAPGDPGAIAWLNAHAPSGAVVLETTGEDYSPAGHARISTFTGLPTVLGWPGHELQWAHAEGTRRADVARLYREPDAAKVRPLLDRYGVRYVVVGPLERADHGRAGEAKWDALGRRVYDRGGTIVWDLQRRR